MKENDKFSVIIWHRYPEETPPKVGTYLTSYRRKMEGDNVTGQTRWIWGDWSNRSHVYAWAEMPRPCEEEP